MDAPTTTGTFKAVLKKDIVTEIRSRTGWTTLVLFVTSAVTVVVFAIGAEAIPLVMSASALWVVILFTSMMGLGRAFISEAERGTDLFLRTHSKPEAVYIAKFTGNSIIAITANLFAVILLTLFGIIPDGGNWAVLTLVVAISGVGLAAVITINSVIVAKAGSRNPLLPVISLPMLIPILMPGASATVGALGGSSLAQTLPDIGLIVSYSGFVLLASYATFDYVWSD